MTTLPFFFNQCLDKGRLKRMILWSLTYQGEYKTIQLIENLKTIGFRYATYAGVSLSIDDLSVPPKKQDEVLEAEAFLLRSTQGEQQGHRTAIEGLQSVIDTWHRTSEAVKQHVIDYFEATDILNPVYMMAFSGARGNVSQVRQLVGMRGLMADAKGDIIGFPIRSNFREGLTITEYMISCYGARKGVVDTALRTADAGYLTRRLVDVAQHIVVQKGSCGTRRGIRMEELKDGNKVVLSLEERLVGRVLAADFTHHGVVIAQRNEPISEQMAAHFSELLQTAPDKPTTKRKGGALLQPYVRSPLTCGLTTGVCQLCYGWSLAQNTIVTLGEAVGIIAGQSIGEPGTQLTMRTFHTGGVFTGEVQEEFRAPHAGWVTFPAPFQGQLVRTLYGQVAFLVKEPGIMLISNARHRTQTRITIPLHTALFVREGEYVRPKQLIGQFGDHGSQQNERLKTKKIVFSKLTGEVVYQNVQFGSATSLPKRFQRPNRLVHLTTATLGTVWILAGDRLGSTDDLLNMYRSSGHLLEPGSTVKRTGLLAMQEGVVCSAPVAHSAVTPTRSYILPPLATTRVRQAYTSPAPNPSPCFTPDACVLYLPIFTGQLRSVHIHTHTDYTRLTAPTGDCVVIMNSLFTSDARLRLGTPKSNRAVRRAVRATTRYMSSGDYRFAMTLYPSYFHTPAGGVFWATVRSINAARNHGLLQWTSRLSFAFTRLPSATYLPFLWQPYRAARLTARRMPVPYVYRTEWVVGHQSVWSSVTLQGQRQRISVPTYGLMHSARFTPRSSNPAHWPIRGTRTPVRAIPNPLVGRSNHKYTLTDQCLLPTPARVSAEFPFARSSPIGPSIGRAVVQPGWLTFPSAFLFNPQCVTPDMHPPGAFQSFTSTLLDVRGKSSRHPAPHRVRTDRLYDTICAHAKIACRSVVPSPATLLLVFRRIFALRHPELIQALLRTSPVPRRAFGAGAHFYVFTHAASPWFALVQPSTIPHALTAVTRPTLYGHVGFMGWVYVAAHTALRNVAFSRHQTRALTHLKFESLLRETCALLYMQPRTYSLDQLAMTRRQLGQMQAFESVRVQEPNWRSNLPLWIKQNVTPLQPLPLSTPGKVHIRHRSFVAPLRQVTTKSIYFLRVVAQMAVPGALPLPQLTFAGFPQVNPLTDHLWSLAVITHPRSAVKLDVVLGRPNTVQLATDPTIARARKLRAPGETFVTRHDDVIFLPSRDTVAFSTQRLPLDSCVVSVGQLFRYGDEITPGVALPVSGQIVAITPTQIHVRRGQPVLFYKSASLHVREHQWVKLGHPIVTLSYQRLVTGDIVQGIPKVEQVFEASRGRDVEVNLHRVLRNLFSTAKRSMVPPKATRHSMAHIQRQIIDRIQRIYISQGVTISDKHFEIIVRQMTSHVRILDPGDTGLFRHEIIPMVRAENVNAGTRGRKARYEPTVLGITAAALNSSSFLSAASFQEMTRVLTRDSVLNRTDFLRGLKERVILGDLIPAGTGLPEAITYRSIPTLLG